MAKVHALKTVPVGSVRPYSGNPNVHSPEQVAALVASIQQFGFTNPLLLTPSGDLIAGHGRLLAALELGLETVPAVILEGLSGAEAKALMVADNQLARLATWDTRLLQEVLAEADTGEFDLGITGFAPDELERIMTWTPEALEVGHTDPDEAPDVPAVPVAVLGDVWVLGRHRIVCGDSCVASVVSAVLNDVAPALMVTDPPYGVEYDPNWRNRATEERPNRGGKRKATKRGAVLNDDRADWREAWALFPGDVAYVWHSGLHSTTVAESLAACNFELRSQIIWAKSALALSRGHYHWQHEPCWYAVRKDKTANWAGDRKQSTLWRQTKTVASTLWEIDKPRSNTSGHGTQKPVECMRRPIVNNSSPGQAVYDPFLGSGSTLIAAQQTARACYGIELNPGYVDVAILRWQAFTGLEAQLEGDGRTFAALGAERAAA